jgi:hypothetical protein
MMCEIAMTIPDESLVALAESPEEASAEGSNPKK